METLLFLWKHRIATFQALKIKFYPGSSNQKAYYSLRRLRRGQFIRVEKMNGTKNVVWRLDRRGFAFLMENACLPELKVKGFRPQSPYHDLLVAGVLLGDWIINLPKSVRLISEQEMLALDLPCLPPEIRKEREHQPDGIWIFSPGKDQVMIALEIEISAKTDDRYEQICAFYSSQICFNHVIWVVKNFATADRILQAAFMHSQARSGVHLFILQEDFEQFGWAAKFQTKFLCNVSMAEFMAQKAGESLIQMNHRRITLESPSNHHGLPQAIFNPFLNFRVSLENLNSLQARPVPENS